MRFSEFSLSEIRAINQRAIRRLQAQEEAMSGQGGAHSVAPEPAWARLPSALFTPSEIRAAFIAAKTKLDSRD